MDWAPALALGDALGDEAGMGAADALGFGAGALELGAAALSATSSAFFAHAALKISIKDAVPIAIPPRLPLRSRFMRDALIEAAAVRGRGVIGLPL